MREGREMKHYKENHIKAKLNTFVFYIINYVNTCYNNHKEQICTKIH